MSPTHQKKQSNAILRFVHDVNDPAKVGFIRVYQEAFAGAPYFETYDPAWVEEHVWLPHHGHCIIVAEEGGIVVGIGCSHPALADTEPAIKSYLQEQRVMIPFPLSSAIFMSELAVLPLHQGEGIGRRIVVKRFQWGEAHGFEHYVMRTADDGSNSQRLYEKLGAHRAPFVQNVRGTLSVESASDKRIYMWGKTREEHATPPVIDEAYDTPVMH